MINSIKEKDPVPLSNLNASPFMIELIGKLLNKNPEARPDAESLISNH
jgi:hypothetical protein